MKLAILQHLYLDPGVNCLGGLPVQGQCASVFSCFGSPKILTFDAPVPIISSLKVQALYCPT